MSNYGHNPNETKKKVNLIFGIGAALGLAAMGGKLIYDKYKENKDKKNKEWPQNNDQNVNNIINENNILNENNIINEDIKINNIDDNKKDSLLLKLDSLKKSKPKIINEKSIDYVAPESFQVINQDKSVEIKNSFICPISKIMMENPVITPYGTTYEKSYIINWIKNNKNDFLTHKPLSEDMLTPNYIMKEKIDEYNQSMIKIIY